MRICKQINDQIREEKEKADYVKLPGQEGSTAVLTFALIRWMVLKELSLMLKSNADRL